MEFLGRIMEAYEHRMSNHMRPYKMSYKNLKPSESPAQTSKH